MCLISGEGAASEIAGASTALHVNREALPGRLSMMLLEKQRCNNKQLHTALNTLHAMQK
jgi:hypothetical protein